MATMIRRLEVTFGHAELPPGVIAVIRYDNGDEVTVYESVA
jgi:hypothetical protein